MALLLMILEGLWDLAVTLSTSLAARILPAGAPAGLRIATAILVALVLLGGTLWLAGYGLMVALIG